MGCRCQERGAALRRIAGASARGDVRTIGRDLAFVGRTLSEDMRSGALARAAQARLSVLRKR